MLPDFCGGADFGRLGRDCIISGQRHHVRPPTEVSFKAKGPFKKRVGLFIAVYPFVGGVSGNLSM